MAKLSNWEVSIEYGLPGDVLVCYTTVCAENITDALTKGMEWVVSNNLRNANVCSVLELSEDEPADDDFTDIIEWTHEEEEAFVSMIDKNGEID